MNTTKQNQITCQKCGTILPNLLGCPKCKTGILTDLTDEQIINKLGRMRHNRDMGYPIDQRKIQEYAEEADKRGLDTY